MGIVAKANKVGFSKVNYYKAAGPGMGILANCSSQSSLESLYTQIQAESLVGESLLRMKVHGPDISGYPFGQ